MNDRLTDSQIEILAAALARRQWEALELTLVELEAAMRDADVPFGARDAEAARIMKSANAMIQEQMPLEFSDAAGHA